MLLFVHGWPDDGTLWRRQVEAMAADYRCVCVTLPNFGPAPERAGGFDFPQLTARLEATVRAVSPDCAVGLVTHDWGAWLGYLLDRARPGLIARMAALDVGGHLGRPGAKAAAMIVAYQWSLVACWLAGGVAPPLGAAMTRAVARVLRVPADRRARLRSRFNYPYFYFWRGLLPPWRRAERLHGYRPSCPVLYLWGERKPLQFHSARWLEIVAAGGGRAEGVAGAGHWLMETHADHVNRRLRDWFAALPR